MFFIVNYFSPQLGFVLLFFSFYCFLVFLCLPIIGMMLPQLFWSKRIENQLPGKEGCRITVPTQQSYRCSECWLEEGFPFLGAGLDILNRFEKSWFLLHKRTKACSQTAESVDGDIVMLSAHWERRKAALTHLQEQLQSLPDFITELDAITANIAQLEGEFAEMESRLLHLETLCCQCEQQTVKNHHTSQLEEYKKKKRKEADLLEAELKCEHAQRVAQMELVMQQKLRERQKVYEEAFNQDVEKYLSTGCLQGKESAGVDVAVLDQMTFINVSDLEALDDFLNSTGEESSCGSSLTSGPDLNSSSLESLNQAPPINSSQSDQAAERQQEEPLVQSDEEDVQADMSLAAVQDVGTAWDSDESDGADPLMEKAQN